MHTGPPSTALPKNSDVQTRPSEQAELPSSSKQHLGMQSPVPSNVTQAVSSGQSLSKTHASGPMTTQNPSLGQRLLVFSSKQTPVSGCPSGSQSAASAHVPPMAPDAGAVHSSGNVVEPESPSPQPKATAERPNTRAMDLQSIDVFCAAATSVVNADAHTPRKTNQAHPDSRLREGP